ncbi:tyrosine-protein phosphatase [Pedobacter sp. P351]|uniref:tyrosine-protein phosphatase n=1 Tax=Pedobacter superstes TaxID=3133441 RepID=UPI0030AD52BA
MLKKIILSAIISLPLISNAQLADSTKRLVHVKGAANFRDVGGYKTIDGKEVKWGKVFRSADISNLTTSDLDTLRERNIVSVVDFRGTKEAAAAPDKLPVGVEYIHCPAGSESLPSKEEWAKQIEKGDMLTNFYGAPNVQYFGGRNKALFQKLLVLPDTSALLYHCTGGRDRTGMATALFLYALGVPMNKIEEDFVASNVYLESRNSKMMSQMASVNGLTNEQWKKMMALRPELLRTFFAALSNEYGTPEKFMEKELGIGKKEIKQLKVKYTY